MQFHFYFVVTDQVSSIFWLLHSDLHEDRVTAVLEYMSSMVASIEPLNQYANGQRGNWNNLSLLEQNCTRGKFHIRFKRRNGRVRVAVIYLSLLCLCLCVYVVLCWTTKWQSDMSCIQCEEFCIEQSGIIFTSISSEDEKINQSLLPKVSFIYLCFKLTHACTHWQNSVADFGDKNSHVNFTSFTFSKRVL